MQKLKEIDWFKVKDDSFVIFSKLIRTKVPYEGDKIHEVPVDGKKKLTKCLTTLDLTSLGVGSCVGTGMYLVTGMVAKKFAGPGVVLSFVIAALASIFSGACYAEFGVRVPHTTGSAYMYSYVTVGEFIAFVIGWNMILEYLIGTSACARALSACFDALCNGAITKRLADSVGTIYDKPPDFLAFGISILMTFVLVAGVKKSLIFNNILNGINLCAWVFIMTAGLFYVNSDNWTQHKGFLPFGWSGVFSGAATCFYAFIGFDIIATTGEEAHNPKRSIPLAIVTSLAIILGAYVTSAMMLTLIVPYDQVDEESALVEMFGQVRAPTCKFIVALGAIAGLTVSMFGSMFPMPRIVYAMAQDGLIFRPLAALWESTGTPALATFGGGAAAAVVAMLVQLEVLVEMMSIGTLLAYTLVSTCVLVLRYQPHSTNLIELLPQSLRTPVTDTAHAVQRETTFISGFQDINLGPTHILSGSQRVMVRRVTRSSPDSDDTLPGDECEEYGSDDQYLVSDRTENKFYGTVHGAPNTSGMRGLACWPFFAMIGRQIQSFSYLCPGLFPWVDLGPPTEFSGMFVMKSVGILYILIISFDLFAAYGSPSTSTLTTIIMTILILAVIFTLLVISRKPQNRSSLLYMTPGLPFVPATAIMVNIYLILNLSVLTLVRFTIWMIFGLVMYFKYGIINSTLEQESKIPQQEPEVEPSVLERVTLPPAKPETDSTKHRNIFEGDGSYNNQGFYGNDRYADPLLAWEDPPAHPSAAFKQLEQRYDTRTNRTSAHTSSRPPWAEVNVPVPTWDD